MGTSIDALCDVFRSHMVIWHTRDVQVGQVGLLNLVSFIAFSNDAIWFDALTVSMCVAG